MATWQWLVLAFLVAVPVTLMVDFWGRERLSSRGRAGRREWRPTPRAAPEPDDH